MIDTAFIEKLPDETAYLMFASLMSADTLVNADKCRECMKIADEIEVAIKEANIPDLKKNAWLTYLNNSKEVIEQNLKFFEDEQNK